MMRVGLFLCLVGAAMAAAVPAGAQTAADTATARDLFIEGSKLAGQNKWEEARDRYERSLALKRAPITLYSLGIAQKNTGQFVEALESLRAFLAEPLVAATKPYEPPARQAIAELERRVADIRIVVRPATAAHLVISIDGAAVPTAALDRARLVNPGEHEVSAEADGRRPAKRSIVVGEGAHATVTLALEPSAPPPPMVRNAPPASSEASSRPSRAAPVVLLVGGGALLAAGVAVGMVGVKEAYDAPTRDGPEADAARRKTIIGDVVGGTGAVVAGIGLIVLIAGGGSHEPSHPPSAWIGPRGGGLRVRF